LFTGVIKRKLKPVVISKLLLLARALDAKLLTFLIPMAILRQRVAEGELIARQALCNHPSTIVHRAVYKVRRRAEVNHFAPRPHV